DKYIVTAILFAPIFFTLFLGEWKKSFIVGIPTAKFDKSALTEKTDENKKQLKKDGRQSRTRSTMSSFFGGDSLISWSDETQMATDEVVWLLVGFSALTLYGGLHAAAWKQHFPTETEALLWLISSIVSTSFATMLILSFIIFILIEKLFECCSKGKFVCPNL